MAGDFNHDGKLDVAEQGIEGIVAVLLGNGDGTFQVPVFSPLGETTSATQYTTADLNGDGAIDLVAIDTNLDTVDVFLGNRDGTFGVARSVSLATDPYFPDAGVVADFNGDGYLDLAVAETNFPNGQVSVELGRGDGSFQAPVVSPLAIQAINNNDAMRVGDFNGDGRPDLAIALDYLAGFQILLGNGDGTFQKPVNTAITQMGDFEVGDLKGDGKSDIVVTYANGTGADIRAYLSNSDGTFTAGAIYTVSSLSAISLADVNGDGKLDLIVTSITAPVQVYLGKGDGTFTTPISGPKFYASGAMVVQDFNGDRKPDLVVGTYSGIAVLLGNGDGTFQSPVYSACGPPTCSGSATGTLVYAGRIIVGDFNGDGNLDLAAYPPADTTLSGSVVLVGNGDGTFQAPLPFSATGTPADLMAGDFNSDGISDLAIPNQAVYGPGGPIVTLYLSGPTLDFFPGSLTFGMQNVGTASPAQQLKLTNQGPGKLTLSSIQNTGDFAQTNDCGAALGKGQSCSISVIFQPTVNGPRSGNIGVYDDAVAIPQLLALAGTGVTRKASVSPSTLSFADQFVDSTATQTITLTNIGNAPLTTSQVTITGTNASDFSQTNNCQSSLAVQGTCGIKVAFTPGTTGILSATVVVTDDALGSPQSVPVSGMGMDFGLAVSSGGSASQTVAAGKTAVYNLVIGGAAFGGVATITCTGAPRGATCSTPVNMTLNPTSTSSLIVNVTTTSQTSTALFLGFPQLWAVALFGWCAVPATRKGRCSTRCLSYFTLIMFLALVCSCGGGGTSVDQPSSNATPAGHYQLMVRASAGSYTQSLPLTLDVQ
jgi:FG-GAP-like repeat